MSRRAEHAFRRKLNELEEAVLLGDSSVSAADVEGTLGPLAADAEGEAPERVRALAGVAAGGRSRSSYDEVHGTAGVRRFTTAGGRVLYLIPVETFPDHVNNVYLVRDRERTFLYDSGSLIPQAKVDLERAARVLAAIYGEPGVLDRVEEVVISHGHMDHFGGVALWRKQGARIVAHELDARVLSNFEERVVVTARALARFLEAAGVAEGERRDLAQMYVMSKTVFRAVPVDRVVVDGAVVSGCIAHHVPGHCPGQICLQVDNVLLTADHVLPRITPHQAPEAITPSTGLDHYFESLEKIRRVGGIDLSLPGHETPIARLHQRIVEIEQFHRGRLDKVRTICLDGPQTIAEIAGTLFGEQRGYGRILAYEEAGAHVEYLARRGRLEIANLEDFEKSENPVVRYKSAA